MLFKEITETEFKTFSKEWPDNNFWQTTNMAHMRERRGCTTSYVGIMDNDKLIAASMLSFVPVFSSYTFCQILRGPLLDYSNLDLFTFFHENLVQFCKKKKCLYFHMDPYLMYKERDIHGDIVEGGIDNSPIFDHIMSLGYTHEGFTRGIDNDREPRWIYTIDTENITKEELLKKAIAPIRDQYDYIIIDCPPSLGLLNTNALTAADSILIPVQCEYYALEGLSQLIHTIELVRDRLNKRLKIEGVVFTMYDARTNLSLQVVENVKENLQQNIYKTIIPRNIRLAEAPSYGMPINL